jgi:hypothetical protein
VTLGLEPVPGARDLEPVSSMRRSSWRGVPTDTLMKICVCSPVSSGTCTRNLSHSIKGGDRERVGQGGTGRDGGRDGGREGRAHDLLTKTV